MKRFQVVRSEHCAWRAVYLYRLGDNGSKARIAHLGIDPEFGAPRVFGSVGRFDWTIKLPHIQFRYPMSPMKLAAYKLQQRMLHAIDGRFSRKTAS